MYVGIRDSRYVVLSSGSAIRKARLTPVPGNKLLWRNLRSLCNMCLLCECACVWVSQAFAWVSCYFDNESINSYAAERTHTVGAQSVDDAFYIY